MADLRADESLAIGFALVARAFERELRAALAAHGVAPGQFHVLLALYEHDGQSQAELARVTAVAQPTMAATLERMERDGLVERAPPTAGGRRLAGVHLTASARRLERPLTDAARVVNRRAVRGLPAADRATLYRLVDRLLLNLGPGAG